MERLRDWFGTPRAATNTLMWAVGVSVVLMVTTGVASLLILGLLWLTPWG